MMRSVSGRILLKKSTFFGGLVWDPNFEDMRICHDYSSISKKDPVVPM